MKIWKSFIVILLLAFAFLANPKVSFAETAAASAQLTTSFDLEKVIYQKQIQTLRSYLEKRNSPLAPHAKTFVDEANKYNLDWKLVAAISGLESSFGLRIPVDSYNGWGFGVYGDNVKRFASWDEGIATVSQALRENYMEKWNAKTIDEIGRIYAASPTWSIRVQYFMNNIEEFEKTQSRTTIALSL